MEKSSIDGKKATYAALSAQQYPPVQIEAPENTAADSETGEKADNLPVSATDAAQDIREDAPRTAPPRVRKPSPINNQYLAPTSDLEGYRARLRATFGNTMSDEFVEVMLGKLIEALKPNPHDQLEEKTLNAALAIIHSAQCRSELEALITLEIVATGFAGLRFLRQAQHFMTEDYIELYGNYADKLLKRQISLLQALDRNQRGHKQTVEVRHLHVHSGAQGLVGIVNQGK